MAHTQEDKQRYNANRRKKYNESEEWRVRRLAMTKKWRDDNTDRRAAERRERYWSEPGRREKLVVGRRGRCQRREQLKMHYGITLEEYNAMKERQGSVCAICRIPKDETLRVDHCHDTGKIRGLLCNKCNLGLGLFGDNEKLVSKAADYLAGQHAD